MTSTRRSTSPFALVFVLLATVLLSMPAIAEDSVLELPATIGDGEDREVTILVDRSDLKLATIILRHGTVLPTHSAPVPATIQVVHGAGVIHVGETPMAVAAGSILVLEAGEEHDVVPEPKSDMLLLVHYLRSAAGHGHESAHDHGH